MTAAAYLRMVVVPADRLSMIPAPRALRTSGGLDFHFDLCRMIVGSGLSSGGYVDLRDDIDCGEILGRDLVGNARRQGEHLRGRFEALAQKYPVVGDVRGKGLFQAVELVADRGTKARLPDAFGQRVGRLALERGLLCRFDPHWIAFGPPLTVTTEDVDAMVDILDTCIGETLG